MTTQVQRQCIWCHAYAKTWCTLTDDCQIEVCSNCDHGTHERERCQRECPECGCDENDADHDDVGGVLVCRNTGTVVEV